MPNVLALMQYLSAEVLELDDNVARDIKKTRIIPRYLQIAIGNDEELNKLLCGATIPQDILPNLQADFFSKFSLSKFSSIDLKCILEIVFS